MQDTAYWVQKTEQTLFVHMSIYDALGCVCVAPVLSALAHFGRTNRSDPLKVPVIHPSQLTDDRSGQF